MHCTITTVSFIIKKTDKKQRKWELEEKVEENYFLENPVLLFFLFLFVSLQVLQSLI